MRQTRTPICRPLAHEDRIVSAAFSPDGARLITATRSFLRIWSLPPDTPDTPDTPDIATTACKMLGDQDKVDISGQFAAEDKGADLRAGHASADSKLMSDR
jgi:WD40 repeat protein